LDHCGQDLGHSSKELPVLTQSLPPIAIDALLDEPRVFRELIERHAPYFPVQRYFTNEAQYRAASGANTKMVIAPNFRGDWAYDTPLVDGAELFLDHPKLAAAAAQLFSTDLIRPQMVYTNLTWQLPFHQGGGHTDVPAFRGIERTQYPTWILNTMGHSGLFEQERVRIATAVAWFYEGQDGGFEYWPNGGDQPPQVHEGDTFNTAIVGDNDRMYHRVMPVGGREDGMLTDMTLDTRLEHTGGNEWRIVGDREFACFGYERLRISVSWKALAFRDEAEQRKVDDHTHDLSFDEVLERFYADLSRRRIAFELPADPLEDEAFVETLAAAYVREPSVFTRAA
jgi:hypothetical protein